MKLRHVQLRKYREEGAVLPPFYGIAYHDHMMQSDICYPVPLNLIVRCWKWIQYWAAYHLKVAKWIPDPMRWAHQKGWQEGRQDYKIRQFMKIYGGTAGGPPDLHANMEFDELEQRVLSFFAEKEISDDCDGVN